VNRMHCCLHATPTLRCLLLLLLVNLRNKYIHLCGLLAFSSSSMSLLPAQRALTPSPAQKRRSKQLEEVAKQQYVALKGQNARQLAGHSGNKEVARASKLPEQPAFFLSTCVFFFFFESRSSSSYSNQLWR
jgi:hypothetical protein